MEERVEQENKKNTKKKWIAVCLATLFFAAIVLFSLQMGVWNVQSQLYIYSPTYPKEDIQPLLEKDVRTKEDYDFIYRQTGLTQIAVDDFLAQGKMQNILEIQDYFFSERTIDHYSFNPFTYQLDCEEPAPTALLRDGDIVVSSSIYVSWWQYGHAALVLDGKEGRVLEAISPGQRSVYGSLSAFNGFATFIILRPKVAEETKKQIVDYAETNLYDIPYRLTVGVLSKKYKEDIKCTQCAHLVWYAYKKFGVDLDSTGGGVVKPQDMANSPLVEVVQVVGFDLDTLWR